MYDLNKILDKLSPIQKVKYASLNKHDKILYLTSFLGIKQKVSPDFTFSNSIGVYKLTPIHTLREHIRKQYDSSTTKRPMSNQAHFGVEIECYLKKDDFDFDCTCECTCITECDMGHQHEDPDNCDGSCRNDCKCSNRIDAVRRSLNRAKIKGIHAENDGSLGSHEEFDGEEYFGVEIQCIFTLENPSNLEKLCDWLKNHEAKIDTTCGLHVHVDTRNVKKELVAKRLRDQIDKLFELTPASRRNNKYCNARDGKYRAINDDTNFDTVEVRIQGGSTDYQKILNWVRVLNDIAMGKFNTNAENWTQGFSDPLLCEWVKNRVKKFSNINEVDDDELENAA